MISNLNIDDFEREKCKRSLSYFIKFFWHTADPAIYIHNWHIDAICEHLEAVSSGQIRKLIINIPPRHQKSLTVAVFWVAWHWITQPETQWLFASYAHSLSKRDSIKCRSVIMSPKYINFYGHIYQLRDDQNLKDNFKNTSNGYRLATSVDGTNTGEGADIIVYDDVNNMKHIMSEIKRKNVNDWHDIVMSSRLNNQKKGRRVIIGQRGHNSDITGHILENESGWEHLCLPAKYESRHPYKSHTSLNFIDPRTEEKELLWKDNFDKKLLKEIETSMGAFGVAGQLQQNPVPVGGGLIKRHWFENCRYGVLPSEYIAIYQSWDTAIEVTKHSAFSTCSTWIETDNRYYLADMFREKLDFPDLERAIISKYDQWKPKKVLIEKKASGGSLIQKLKKETKIPIIPIIPDRIDKLTRMHIETPLMESGRMWLPKSASWLMDFEKELFQFPASAYADQIDCISQFLNHVRLVPKPIWGGENAADDAVGEKGRIQKRRKRLARIL